MNRRLAILGYWLAGQRNGVSLRDLAAFLSSPTRPTLARDLVLSREPAGHFIRVRLRHIASPLYYPARFRIADLDEVVCEILNPADWHYYETPETRVQPEDVVIDCGAAEGLFALTVAARCRQVYAVEPLADFVRAMQLTFREQSNVTVLPVAVSSFNGAGRFSERGIVSALSDGAAGPDSPNGELVSVQTLDALLASQPRVDYIKADLEGGEIAMLDGAREIIRRHQPKIAITTYHRPDHAQLIADRLTQLVPAYHIKVKGIFQGGGAPVMLHAWVPHAW